MQEINFRIASKIYENITFEWCSINKICLLKSTPLNTQQSINWLLTSISYFYVLLSARTSNWDKPNHLKIHFIKSSCFHLLDSSISSLEIIWVAIFLLQSWKIIKILIFCIDDEFFFTILLLSIIHIAMMKNVSAKYRIEKSDDDEA